MANFCTKCGKPLEGRKICPCQMADQQSEQEQYQKQLDRQAIQAQYQQQFNQAKEKSTNYLLELLYTFLDILKKPKQKGAELIAKQQVSIMIGLILIQGILSAFVGLLYTNKVSSVIGTMTSILGTFSLDTLSENLNLEMPMARIFIITVIGSAVLSCILALLIWIAGSVMRLGCTLKQAFGVVAVRSVILIPVILIAAILALLNPGVGLGCYVIGNVCGFCYMVAGFNTLAANKSEMVPIMLSIIIILFMAAGYFVITRLSLYYLPDTIRTAIGTAKSLFDNPADLMERIGDIL